jgi:hypothetical protein
MQFKFCAFIGSIVGVKSIPNEDKWEISGKLFFDQRTTNNTFNTSIEILHPSYSLDIHLSWTKRKIYEWNHSMTTIMEAKSGY